jgi:thioredoxin 1
MSAIHIDDNEFDAKVINSGTPVLVDFWAEWCGPCRQISPVLEEIAKERAGKVVVAKVNIDKNPGTPQKYGVRGIPTLILFKGGQPVSTKVGSLPKSKLLEWVDSLVA